MKRNIYDIRNSKSIRDLVTQVDKENREEIALYGDWFVQRYRKHYDNKPLHQKADFAWERMYSNRRKRQSKVKSFYERVNTKGSRKYNKNILKALVYDPTDDAEFKQYKANPWIWE